MKTNNFNKSQYFPPFREGLGVGLLALKSLWARRKNNAWLFAELILVTIVCWVVLDPVIVTLYHKNLPLGYDKDRLCLVQWGFDPSLFKPGDNPHEQQEQLLKRFKADFTTSDVEHICAMGTRYLESQGGQSNIMYSDTTTQEKTKNQQAYVRFITFVKGEPFLETHGIKMLYGEEDTKRYIENPDLFGQDNVIVISRATANWFFGKDDAVGEYLYEHNYRKVEVDGRTDYKPYNHSMRVIGVYDDVRTSESRHNEFTRLSHQGPQAMVVRLKQGADVEAYCNMVREKIKDDNYTVGCAGISSITSYDQLMEENSYRSGYTGKLRFNMSLASLFLFSLCLGVIGTFWLQTKQRKGEVGVMRSFGASRNGIMHMIISEGTLLATASVVIGCLIYFQYTIKEGLNLGFYNSMENEDGSPLTVSIENASNLDWVNTFGEHFLIVSAIVYLLILAVVIIGVSIPAKRLSSIPPVDALREE